MFSHSKTLARIVLTATGAAVAEGENSTAQRFAPTKKFVDNIFQGFFRILARL